MTGLRNRQKRDRERRILDAASRLFRARGYAETHMEAIAAERGLSVGALYNYYRSKGDLLAAIVGLEVTEVLKLGEALVADPAAALDTLVAIYFEHSLVYLDNAMWRTVGALVFNNLDRATAMTLGALKAEVAAHHRIVARAVCSSAA